jgi:hypothetical protein
VKLKELNSISERLLLKMVILHVPMDDHTYVYGGMVCEVDEDGNGIEPFIYKEGAMSQ